jgi:hypothetical protein
MITGVPFEKHWKIECPKFSPSVGRIKKSYCATAVAVLEKSIASRKEDIYFEAVANVQQMLRTFENRGSASTGPEISYFQVGEGIQVDLRARAEKTNCYRCDAATT